MFADDKISMINQGIKINSWSKNVYVKIPVNQKIVTGKVIKELNKKILN